MRTFSKIARLIIEVCQQASKKYYFGFISSHAYLSTKELAHIKSMVGKDDSEVVHSFEREFAAIVGKGDCVSYAAGRMGFYAVMQTLRVGEGDEVILTGATCAVMVNAVLRTGATPVFSDIDPNTFGASPASVSKCITSRTRLIVAQHSFGIPCDIIPIVDLARKHNIFLLEDCALTLGSKVNDVVVGNFGDAAIFSTDHSKPINTITGGMIYTRNPTLALNLRQTLCACDALPLRRQQALWRRLLLERTICDPFRYRWMGLIDLLSKVKYKIFNIQQPFLLEDFSSKIRPLSYAYPAKMPAFLALLGLYEIRQWPNHVAMRKRVLKNLLDIAKISFSYELFPKAYHDNNLDIVPLRLAWADENGEAVRKELSAFVHTSWTWFMQPIVATNEPLKNYGYKAGDCPISENIGFKMINLPCNVTDEYISIFFKLLKKQQR